MQGARCFATVMLTLVAMFVVLLRLAALLHRTRSPSDLPAISLSPGKDSLELKFPQGWLDDNPLTAADLEQETEWLRERGFELTNLAVRKDMADSPHTTERRLKRFFDSVLVPADLEHALSPKSLRRMARDVRTTLAGIDVAGLFSQGMARALRPVGQRVQHWKDNAELFLEGADRQLARVQKLFELYRPFIHDHDYTFECRALKRHVVAEHDLRFAPESIEWRPYWLHVHMPGLRRWCFPEYEGKERETYRPAHAFELLPPTKSDSETEQAREEVG